MTQKRLYRSQDNKVFAGIFGGIGEYLEVDPALLRVLWVAMTVFTGFVPGLLIYLLGIFIIPRRPQSEPHQQSADANEAREEHAITPSVIHQDGAKGDAER